MKWCVGLLAALPLAAWAQGPLLDDAVAAVRDNLARLPNYTCTVELDRSQRAKGNKEFHPVDRVRLEVALVKDQELYAWPGSHKFSDQPIYGMVGGGMIGTGQFGLFVETVFLSGVAKLRYAGREELDGRSVQRFRYQVPRALSRYEIRLPGAQDTVGMEGSAWLDARTMDLVRLEVVVREIPDDLPLESGWTVIDYARQKVGGGEFLLPEKAEQQFTIRGLEARNLVTFSTCKAYQTESAISFDEKPETSRAQPAAAPIIVPAGVQIQTKLMTELDSERVARGDAFEARITKAAKHKGEVVAPMGAIVRGRVTSILRSEGQTECIGVMLQPERIEFGGREGAFAADQADLPSPAPGHRMLNLCPFVAEPGTAILVFSGRKFHATAGTALVWLTVTATEER